MFRSINRKKSTPKKTSLFISLKPFYYCFFALFFFSCQKTNTPGSQEVLCTYTGDTSTYKPFSKPNIIFILGDDIGYEIPTYTGGQSYSTPNIDRLAAGGTQFTQCFSLPNCSPSRIELLSGVYNFRNYTNWGIYNTNYKTFANLLQKGGYKTSVTGKWQMDGGDESIKKMGFDDYLVFDPFVGDENDDENNKNDYRYKNPKLYSNSVFLPTNETEGKYSEDLFTEHICKFINDNRAVAPLFVYYSMSLCHRPYSPTPDNPEFESWQPTIDAGKPKFFPSMVEYMDKMVGRIIKTLEDLKMINDTYIIFTGDNGTPTDISSLFQGQTIVGGKGNTNEYGTHVPLVIYCPANVGRGIIKSNLIDFTDFLPTLADIAKISIPVDFGPLDGHSFYQQLNGSSADTRDWIFGYWKPSSTSDTRFKRYAQNYSYKLYDSTFNKNFFNIKTDKPEVSPLRTLSPEETIIKNKLQNVLDSLK